MWLQTKLANLVLTCGSVLQGVGDRAWTRTATPPHSAISEQIAKSRPRGSCAGRLRRDWRRRRYSVAVTVAIRGVDFASDLLPLMKLTRITPLIGCAPGSVGVTPTSNTSLPSS